MKRLRLPVVKGEPINYMFPDTAGKDCPMCSCSVDYEFDCPGWMRAGTIMVCQGCGNTERWFCTSYDCGWWYLDSRLRSNTYSRPDWLDE